MTQVPNTPEDLIAWLFVRQRFGTNLGLDRVKQLLKELANPQDSFEVILVGGTNGKGSTASTLASILQASGRKTALFTSPHLTYFNERFIVNGRRIEQDRVVTALEHIKPYAETLNATFFEVVVALACLLFKEEYLDIAVMELGMGGKNDATNALEPILSIITNVSLDHTAILGNSVEEIALEKSGIMRHDKLCLTAAVGGAAEVIKMQAQQLGSELWFYDKQLKATISKHDWQGLSLRVESPKGNTSVKTPLRGRFQATNVALAVAAAHYLEISDKSIKEGVAKTTWPGRLELINYKDRRFLLDGAHNAAAAQELVKTLQDLNLNPCLLIFGINRDREPQELLAPLKPFIKKLIFTQAQLSPKAVSAHDLQQNLGSDFAFLKPDDAIEKAVQESQEGEIILVAGSLYLIGEVRPYLLKKEAEGLERWQ